MQTSGWDVVNARSLTCVNDGLAKLFAETPLVVEFPQGTLRFGPWNIVGRTGTSPSGGSDELLDVDMEVVHGDWKHAHTTIPLTGAKVRIEIRLGFLDGASTENVRDLRFHFQESDAAPSDSVVVKSIVLPDVRLPTVIERTLADELAQCLVAQREKVAFILARLDMAPKGEASWLALRQTHFYLADGGNDLPGYFVLLGMLRDGHNQPREAAVDPALLDGNDQCTAFAPSVFLEHFLKPHLGQLFQVPSDEFRLQGDEIVCMGRIPVRGAELPMWMDRISIHIVDDKLETRTQGQGLATREGDTMEFRSLSHSAFRFHEGNFELVADPNPEIHFRTHLRQESRKERIWKAIGTLGGSEILRPLIQHFRGIVVDGLAQGLTQGLRATPVGTQALEWSEHSLAWNDGHTMEVRDAGLSDAFYVRAARTATSS